MRLVYFGGRWHVPGGTFRVDGTSYFHDGACQADHGVEVAPRLNALSAPSAHHKDSKAAPTDQNRIECHVSSSSQSCPRLGWSEFISQILAFLMARIARRRIMIFCV